MDGETYENITEEKTISKGLDRGKNDKLSSNQPLVYERLNHNDRGTTIYDDLHRNKSAVSFQKLLSYRKYLICLVLGLFSGSVFTSIVVFFAVRNNEHCISVAKGQSDSTSNGYIHVLRLNSSIKFYKDRLSWKDAQARCINEGGNLIVLNTERRNRVFLTYVKLFFENSQWWIGATDRKEEGQFHWVTGEMMSYQNWKPSQRDNKTKSFPNADCVIYIISKKYDYWYDQRCHYRVPFFCERNTILSGSRENNSTTVNS